MNKTTVTRTLQVITALLIVIALYSNHKKEAATEATNLQAEQQAKQQEAAQRAAERANSEAREQAAKPNREALLATLKEERKIKDAGWLNEHNNSILVGVLNDGSRQDDYADYICGLMVDHELYGGIVRITDIDAATRDKWTELGRADCMTKEQASTVTMVKFGPNGETKQETAISREKFNRQLSK